MKFTKEIEFDITPEECGRAFVSFSDEQVAAFMKGIANRVSEAYKIREGFSYGMQAVHHSGFLTEDARWIMQQFGEDEDKFWCLSTLL